MLSKDLERFLQNTRGVGARTLSFLGKTQSIVRALESEVGEEILKDALSRHDLLAEKVLEGTASPEEISERKALHSILIRWSSIITQHNEAKDFVKTHSN